MIYLVHISEWNVLFRLSKFNSQNLVKLNKSACHVHFHDKVKYEGEKNTEHLVLLSRVPKTSITLFVSQAIQFCNNFGRTGKVSN